jgi:hypothetical protein
MRSLLLATALSLSLIAHEASAAITQETSAAGIGANNSIDWSIYGPPGATVSTPEFMTVGPETVSPASSSGTVQILKEGTDFTGIFSPGDNLMDQPFQSDSTIVSFSSPVLGVGTHIQSGLSGAFTAYMELFDSANTLLGTVSVTGNNTGAEDGSAPYIGALSDTADISYIELY